MSKKPESSEVPADPETALNTAETLQKILRKNGTRDTPYKATVIRVTPEVAEQILSIFNVGNRPVSGSLVKEYTHKFLNGQWEQNGEPLLFGETENGLIEGVSLQHRLKALCKAASIYNEMSEDERVEKYPDAQLEFIFPVIYGMKISTADTVDTGKTRKHADVLFRNPVIQSMISEDLAKSESSRRKWASNLSVAARLVWLREHGLAVSGGGKFSIEEMVQYITEVNTHLPKIVSTIMEIAADDDGNRGLRISLGYIAALTFMAAYDGQGSYDSVSEQKVLESLRAVSKGVNLSPGSPEAAIVGYWNSLAEKKGSLNRDIQVVGPFVRYLNAVLSEETGLKAKSFALTAKDEANYSTSPPLISGWDQQCWEAAQASLSGDSVPVSDDAGQEGLE